MAKHEKDYMTLADALDVLSEFGVAVPREKIKLSAACSPVIELSFKDLFGDAYGPSKANQPLVFVPWRDSHCLHKADDPAQLRVEATVYNKPVLSDCNFIRQCMLGKRKTPFGSQGYTDVKPDGFLILSPREFRKNLDELKRVVKLRNGFIAQCNSSKSCQQCRENVEKIKKLKAENTDMYNAVVQQYCKKQQLVYESAENDAAEDD